jgi:hypothetical protein
VPPRVRHKEPTNAIAALHAHPSQARLGSLSGHSDDEFDTSWPSDSSTSY